MAAYWLFVVLMLATFTANLAAFLTVERMQVPFSLNVFFAFRGHDRLRYQLVHLFSFDRYARSLIISMPLSTFLAINSIH